MDSELLVMGSAVSRRWYIPGWDLAASSALVAIGIAERFAVSPKATSLVELGARSAAAGIVLSTAHLVWALALASLGWTLLSIFHKPSIAVFGRIHFAVACLLVVAVGGLSISVFMDYGSITLMPRR